MTLVDPERAAAPHEMVLLNALFSGQPPGAVADLSAQGSLTSRPSGACRRRSGTRSQAAAGSARCPRPRATGGIGFGAIAFALFGIFAVGAWVLWIVLPLLPVIITFAGDPVQAPPRTADRRRPGGHATRSRASGPTWPRPRPTNSASRRARTSSRSTCRGRSSSSSPTAGPRSAATWWRWAGCPNEVPYWYVGNYNMAAFNTSFITSSLTTRGHSGAVGGQQWHRLRRWQLVRRRRLLRRRRWRRRRRQLGEADATSG